MHRRVAGAIFDLIINSGTRIEWFDPHAGQLSCFRALRKPGLHTMPANRTRMLSPLELPDAPLEIVIVTHGEGRGRPVPTGEAFMRRVRKQYPAFAARLRIHRTGQGQLDFRNVALIAFWLGDPLQQKYPECYLEAVAIADMAQTLGIRVLNPPHGLCNTTKSEQARIWNRIGLPSARAGLAVSPDTLPVVARQIGLPCIIRSDSMHNQREVTMVHSESDLMKAASATQFPAAVIGLIDVQAAWKAVDPALSCLFSQFHHKARAFVFGGAVKTSHLFFSTNRIVGMSNSVFAREDTPRRKLARRLGLQNAPLSQMISADLYHFRSPAAGASDLVRAVAALGLDFAAVDYSLLPNGGLVIWEANPYFYLPDGKSSVLSAERRAVERVNETFDWMALRLVDAFNAAAHDACPRLTAPLNQQVPAPRTNSSLHT